MATDLLFEEKQRKSAELAIVRLKYRLMANRALHGMDLQRKQALKSGDTLRLETTLEELLSDATS